MCGTVESDDYRLLDVPDECYDPHVLPPTVIIEIFASQAIQYNAFLI